MKLKLAEAALEEIERIDAWWVTHRDKNPDLFRKELEAAFEQIEANPSLGRIYDKTPVNYRWVLMPKTRHLVFYEYHLEPELIAIVMVWSPRQGGDPPFR